MHVYPHRHGAFYFSLKACVAAAQFTDLQQKEQLAKLAMARSELAAAPATRKFKFVSGVNEQVCHALCACLLPPCFGNVCDVWSRWHALLLSPSLGKTMLHSQASR